MGRKVVAFVVIFFHIQTDFILHSVTQGIPNTCVDYLTQ